MKVCLICLKNDFLCTGCRKKLENNSISNTDISLSRALFRLGINARFIKSFDTESYVVVLSDKANSGLLIGRAGRNVKRLCMMLGKDIKVIEHTRDERKFIENILNTPVLGINKIYGNNELYKIKVENRFRRRVENLSPLLSKVLEKNVRFVFE